MSRVKNKSREEFSRLGRSMRRRLDYAARVTNPARIVPVKSSGALLLRDVDPDTRALIDEFKAKRGE